MNYIGSKQTLLPFIDEVITLTTGNNITTFTDGFAGTGVVTDYFAKKYPKCHVHAGDIQSYSTHVTMARTGSDISYDKILKYCDELNRIDGIEGFIFRTDASDNVMYFTPDNAKKCDAIRQQIEKWYQDGKITYNEYSCLIGILVENVDKVANTASIYGAFLKKYKKSALKSFTMIPFEFEERIGSVNIQKKDVVEHIQMLKTSPDLMLDGQHVLYLDPPYNERQYASYYHVLETIANYDSPTVKGMTRIRDWSSQKSKWCNKKTAKEELDILIKESPHNHIYLSYNNEGIMTFDDIKEIFEKYGEYSVYEKEYNRYKADNNREYKSEKTIEYIHYCYKKNI